MVTQKRRGAADTADQRAYTASGRGKRLGYSQLASYIGALNARNFSVAGQASWSPELTRFAADHGYAVYREKEDAGLTLRDRTGASFYRARYPERTYENFKSVPQLVVST